jgi:type IV pilus assembly protein PilM
MLFSNILFPVTSPYPIGLDISDLSLKLVQLNKIKDKITIQALNKINLPKGLFENGEIKNKEEITKYITKLIEAPKYGKITSREVVACLPEPKTFIKLIEVKKTSTDIPSTIESEIEKHVPMSIKEIYYDWQIIENDADKQLILIGAAERNIVNQYTELLDAAKLSITALEIEPISLCRSLLPEEHYKFKGERKNYAIIDIGAKRSSMTVYAKNTILFTLSMPISGIDITEKIAKTLKIDYKQAEKAKIVCGLDETKAHGVIKKMLANMIKELTGKINDALTFYNRHFGDYGPINKILLCGGGANIKNLDEMISKSIAIKVKRGDALINLNEDKQKIAKIMSETYNLNTNLSLKTKNKALKITQNASSTFATAIGLALRGVFIDKL